MKKILRGHIENILQKIGDGCGETFRKDGWFFALLVLLNIPVFLELFTKTPELTPDFFASLFEYATLFILGAIQIFVFCVAIYFLFRPLPRVKIFVQAVTSIYFLIVCVTEIFLIFKFQTSLNRNAIAIILGTNPYSVKEFLHGYVLKPEVIVGLVAGIIFVAFFIGRLKKFFAEVKFPERLKFFSKPIRYSAIVIILFCFVFRWGEWLVDVTRTGFLYPQYGVLKSVVPVRFTAMFAYYIRRVPIGNEEKIFAEMDKLNETEKILENNSEIPYIILVIGESADRNYMSLYGYNLETNPLLQKRLDGGELIRFNDVIACGNYTAIVMSKLGTFAEKDDELNDWIHKANIFDIVKRAGYHTFWISNQSHKGLSSNFDSYFSARCDDVLFTDIAFGERGLDELLLKATDEYLKKSYEKNFYVLHLTGQHSEYDERYTPEFAKFTAEDVDKPEKLWREKTAEYANATLYNDFILDEIIKRFEDKNAVMIYLPDHGEEVYEGRNFAGHSFEPVGNLNMIEIPMLVWVSKIFREKYPEKVERMKAAVDEPYRNDYLIHAILDLADIHTTSYDPTKSIWNKNFEPRPRIYNEKLYQKK